MSNDRVKISKEQMLKRVARFKDLVPTKQAFVDSHIPGYERETLLVIGRGVTEDPTLRPAIPDAKDFNVSIVRTAPGKLVGLHDHLTVEVFIPLTGRWAICWGDNGENEIVLEQWDTISIPPGVMRAFSNVGTGEACLLAITGGTDSGHVMWAQALLDRAKATGLQLDENGNLISERA